jgi:hypothetical protein
VSQNYKLNSVVIMKKGHPCGENKWRVVRVGADIKIQCMNCGRVVMLPRVEFNKKLKEVLIYED